MESYLPDGGIYHHSHFHNEKGEAAHRTHDLQKVTEAEEAEQGFELGTVGSKG